MFDMLMRMRPKKKAKSSISMAGAVSLAAVSGALITWYTTRRMRNRRENEFLYNDEESQP
ncbi:MAG: hypothetical protein JL50_19550 [Peptococcaceae bacterium BICA1-7]|nr:MAG: hypothetical protein JL50_19550 [Peptococcaceae bacterium BICA1-7]HBV98271.1 hypothetical protein [Desulfotomaculum sp.]